MLPCVHEEIQLTEERSDGMHCQGWTCPRCQHLAVGECHHESWCRVDFCGADPIVGAALEPELVGA